MASFTCLNYHLVFSTNGRQPFIIEVWQQRLCVELLRRHEIAFDERYVWD